MSLNGKWWENSKSVTTMRTRREVLDVNQQAEIKRLLEKHPHLRDDDQRLAFSLIYFYLGKEKFEAMSLREFADQYTCCKIPSFDSVARMRRIVQRQHPHLLGNRKESRREAEHEIRQSMR